MGQQLNIPAVGVSSLEMLACLVPENKLPAVVLDARKGCGYFYVDGEIKGAVALDDIEQVLKNGNYYLITDNKLKERLGGVSYQECEYPLGDILAKLCYVKLQNSKYNWQDLKPLYIQPPPMG